MKPVVNLLVIAIIFSFAIATTAEARKRVKRTAQVRAESGEVITIYNHGVTVANTAKPSPNLSCDDCFSFCDEVCATGQVDTCFCGGQSFDCGLGLPPVCDNVVVKE